MTVIPAKLVTALASANVSPFYAVEFMFDSSPIRLWTGIGDRVIGGETYTGSSTLLSIGDLSMTADLSAPSLEISLSGMPGEIISLALTEPFQRRDVNVWFGAKIAGYVNYNDLVGNINDYEIAWNLMGAGATTDSSSDSSEFLAYSGVVNTMRINDGPSAGTVTVVIDSKQVELQKASGWRYTSESHKARNSGDTFFDYVSAIQDAEVVWGRQSV